MFTSCIFTPPLSVYQYLGPKPLLTFNSQCHMLVSLYTLHIKFTTTVQFVYPIINEDVKITTATNQTMRWMYLSDAILFVVIMLFCFQVSNGFVPNIITENYQTGSQVVRKARYLFSSFASNNRSTK